MNILKIIGGGILGYCITYLSAWAVLFFGGFSLFGGDPEIYTRNVTIAVIFLLFFGSFFGMMRKTYFFFGTGFIFLGSFIFRTLFADNIFFMRASEGGSFSLGEFIFTGLFLIVSIFGWLLGFSGQWLWHKSKKYLSKKRSTPHS